MVIEFTPEAASWTANAAGTFLCLPASSPAKILGELAPGKPYTAEIRPKRKKRSLDANGYYWELCGKIAKRMNRDKDEIYRHHIGGLGNYAVYGMQEDAVPMFEQLWTSGHIGRFIETRAAKLPGVVNVLAYYGSSDFDTAQMSRLIDNCIQDCKALGIETRPPEDIESLLEQWREPDAQQDKSPANP